MKVVLIYSHKSGTQDMLESQLMAAGIETVHMWVPFSWKKKIEIEYMVSRENPDDLLLFIDTWDVEFVGTKQEILDLHLEDGITFAAAKMCWPQPEKKPLYPAEESPWGFVNGGLVAGLGKNIAAALDWGLCRFPITKHTSSLFEDFEHIDQRFLTDLFLEGRDRFNIRLDTRCEAMQVFCGLKDRELFFDGSRMVNTVFGTKPIFLHVNAGSVEIKE